VGIGYKRTIKNLKGKEIMKYALVREIPDSFDRCIKPEVNPQPIDVGGARAQHLAYREALSSLGYTLIVLSPDNLYPDCPFVEDTAVVLNGRALITRPGALSRRGEVGAVAEALCHFLELTRMEAPATLDGGDVLRIGHKIFVGRTNRTNDEGIATLAAWAGSSYEVTPVNLEEALHLKSVVNHLGKGIIFISGKGVDTAVFSGFEVVEIKGREAKRLSFLPVGNTVFLPSDCPETRALFESKGFTTIPLDIYEIRKAQAGLTCMSVLFEA